MTAIDSIRQIHDEQYTLIGKNRRLIVDRFEIGRYGTFWTFWYGRDQHFISFQHVPDNTDISNAMSYYDALYKSVEAYNGLRLKLETNNKK